MSNSSNSPVDGVGKDQGKSWNAFNILGVLILLVVVACVGLLFLWPTAFKPAAAKPYQQAFMAIEAQDWNKAVKLFKESLKKAPGSAEAYVGLSRAYFRLGMMDEALGATTEALKLDSKNPRAYGMRGIALKLRNQPDKALEDFILATKYDPAYVWAYAQIADILVKTKDFDKALANVDIALKTKPDYVDGLRLRGRILAGMGRCEEALADLTKAVELRPDYAMAVQDKAWILLTCPVPDAQDPNQAMELAKKAYELGGKQEGRILETLAEAYFHQGAFAKAIEHQRKAIDMEKKRCPDESCLGEMKKRLEKYEMAARQETRPGYDILPTDPATKP